MPPSHTYRPYIRLGLLCVGILGVFECAVLSYYMKVSLTTRSQTAPVYALLIGIASCLVLSAVLSASLSMRKTSGSSRMLRGTIWLSLSTAIVNAVAVGTLLIGPLIVPAIEDARNPVSRSGLLDAIKTGDARRVESIIDSSPGLLNTRYHERLPLDLAVTWGKKDVTEALLKAANRWSIGIPDNESLLIAIAESNVDMVRLLLEYGIDVNAKRAYGSTPLHWAAIVLPGRDEEKRKRIIELLVAGGADVRAKNGSGQTPYDYAVRQNFGSKEFREFLKDITTKPVGE